MKEYKSLSEDEIESDNDTPEREFFRNLARDAVLGAVTELPERFRMCIDLFFFYDQSYEEIEVITGYPVNTIKSHVFRAKKILREKLAAYTYYGQGGAE
jgi:RNA polymerase sigma-70 factor (ECF subfamily)